MHKKKKKTATGSWLQSVQPTFTHLLLLSSMVMRRWMAACLQAGEADAPCSCGLLRMRQARFSPSPLAPTWGAWYLNGRGVEVGRMDWWRLWYPTVAAGSKREGGGGVVTRAREIMCHCLGFFCLSMYAPRSLFGASIMPACIFFFNVCACLCRGAWGKVDTPPTNQHSVP